MKLIHKTIFIIFIGFTLSTNAATQSVSSVINKQTKQIRNLTSRIEGLENTISDLKKDIAELKRNGNSRSRENLSSDEYGNLQPEHTMQNQAEAAGGQVAGTQVTGAFSGEVAAAAVTTLGTLAGAKKKVDISEDKRDYDIALGLLKEKRYKEAENKFSTFIRKHPNSRLQSNAIFWYAESFYQQGIYNKAAVHFLKGYKEHPKGSKAADSLLKLSFSLSKLGKNQEACNMLAKLDSEFASRPASSIKRANELKDQIGCAAIKEGE